MNQANTNAANAYSGGFISRVWWFVVGLAEDFWKDGSPEVVKNKKEIKKTIASDKPEAAPKERQYWNASAAQLAEQLWGQYQNLPYCDDFYSKVMPLIDLTKDSYFLDLTAGGGGMAVRLIGYFRERVAQMKNKQNFMLTFDCLEQDAEFVKRCKCAAVEQDMKREIRADIFNPADYKPARKYDFILARELFCRLADKKKFFSLLSSNLKPRGQVIFTDFVMQPEAKGNKDVAAWLAAEQASPLSLSEMTQEWAKLGFDVRVNEDQTEIYKKEVLRKIALFAAFLGQNPPDAETKQLVVKEILRWVRRMSAIGGGLKYCRFYAIKV